MRKPIFISYSRRDSEKVLPFVKELEHEIGENRIWIDWSGVESGDEFEDRIIKAIDESKIILFMLSDNSMDSEYAKKEIHYAYNNKKKVVPIVLDGKTLRGWFQFKFGNINFTDILNPDQVNQLKNNLKDWTNAAIKQQYFDLAEHYLRDYPKTERYCVTYERGVDDMCFYRYIPLTQKERDCIEHLTQELDVGMWEIWEIMVEDPCGLSDIEGFDSQYTDVCKSLVEKLDTNDEFWPAEFDLKKPEKSYKFRRAFFLNGFDQKPDIYHFRAFIHDNDYLRLLALKMEDRRMSFNELRVKMPDLFNSISSQAESSYDIYYSPSAPYAIEMTEVDEDVFNIIGEESAGEEIYNQGSWADTDDPHSRRRHTHVNIDEKKLSFRMEEVNLGLYGDIETVSDVDAILVEKAMGVNTYAEIIERMKVDFAGPDGVQSFKSWLNANSIDCKYSESHT